jgi:hypothetical protein
MYIRIVAKPYYIRILLTAALRRSVLPLKSEALNLLSLLCLSFFYFPMSQSRKKFYIYVLRGLKKDDEEAAAIENDWKFAAMVLDRSSFHYYFSNCPF